MSQLVNRKVLITGAARGIGYCTAVELARAGAELILTDIDAEGLRDAARRLEEMGATVHRYTYDVSKQKAVEEAIAKIRREVGDPDVLINNAGVGHSGELAETTLRTWKKLVDVDLYGPLYHVYAVLPYMKERKDGQIINVSSGQAFFRLPTWGAYAAVKAALAVFSEVLHYELRPYGIRVTTVYPFMVNTPFYDGIQGESWGARMSMKLVPYYSMKPETVGRILRKAVQRHPRVERVSVLNEVAVIAQAVPFAAAAIARTASLFLLKRRGSSVEAS